MNDVGRNRGSESKIGKLGIAECILISILIILFVLLEVSFFKIFDKTPALSLALICAAGFLCGERTGALCGIFGGFMLDMLGSDTLTFFPLIYMLAGYLCGYFPKMILSRNFPSFAVYAACVGGIRSIISIGYFALMTKSFNVIDIFSKRIIPEFFAFIIFVPIAYFICFGIHKLKVKLSRTN